MNDYDDNPDLSEGAMAYLNGNARKQRLHEEEDARLLARYDEATLLVNLLLSVVAAENVGGQYYDLIDRAEVFLAAEPTKKGSEE